MRIFVSYASEDRALADRLTVGLRQEGYNVFFDRDHLPPGGGFDRKIRDAIRRSDYVVFLISPDAVAAKAYFRTEVSFAREAWESPDNRVLPIMARPTDLEQVPAYLQAAGILMPDGDIVAEVLARVDPIGRRWKRQRQIVRATAAAAVALAAATGWYLWPSPKNAENCQLNATLTGTATEAEDQGGKIKIIGGESKSEFMLNRQGNAVIEVDDAQLPKWTIEIWNLDGEVIGSTDKIHNCPRMATNLSLGNTHEIQISPR